MLRRSCARLPLIAVLGLLLSCAGSTPKKETPTRAELSQKASLIFGTLPREAASRENIVTEAKINLGRKLYYDKRLSKNHDVACNSCHLLDRFGVDGDPTSTGHRGQVGGRNSPTVYNAAFQIAQFWDGRAANVEEQAKGPPLNPIEMAMPSEDYVVRVLRSISGYAPLFDAAFPGEEPQITYDQMARAIGAFERRLVTPSRFDKFQKGNLDVLSPDELWGLDLFMSVGCLTCHNGPLVGGAMYQKIGLLNAYPTDDLGRYEVSKLPADRYVFKVPSLRNVGQTGPYFHDGKVGTLDEAVRLMAYHQLDRKLTEQERTAVVAFLGSLTGRIDASYIAEPMLPANGPDTPAPDPS